MNDKINSILQRIHLLEMELEAEINAAGERLSYSIQEKRILFEASVAAYHRSLRKGLLRFIREASVLHMMTAPVIYSLIFPLALLDLCVVIYQAICFPIYGIKKVPRSDFIVIDRESLAYLNVVEKINCAYCGYANGLAAYLREVAARTEEYWCPIKHAHRIRQPHSRYHKFVPFGDAEAYRERMKELMERRSEENGGD
ncbi:MAG: hypothetical protein OEV92_09570 [Nitrospinota bacterium]|nr:hypothetical protein [Nitrospinota bacterium]